jgi:hypothetical protein
MTVGEGCDLREVSNAEDLMKACELFEFAADDLADGAANACVNFVENYRRDAAGPRGA